MRLNFREDVICIEPGTGVLDVKEFLGSVAHERLRDFTPIIENIAMSWCTWDRVMRGKS
jgi:hypothetical protein